MWRGTEFVLVLFLSSWTFGIISARTYRLEENIVADVCAVQCESLCFDLSPAACERVCGRSGQKQVMHAHAHWAVQCSPAIWTLDCVGSCSTVPNATGYVPEKPQARVNREPSNGKITLSWERDPLAQPHTLYLVAQRENTDSWKALGWVRSEYYQVTSSEPCAQPQFKVAAVSRYGSRWFSEVVTAPQMQPGPPVNGTLQHLAYNPTRSDTSSVDFTIQWMPPKGWALSDILHYPIYSDPLCFSFDPVHVRIRTVSTHTTSDNLDLVVVTGKIPTRAIGCKIKFYIHAVSRCSRYLQGPPMAMVVDMDCQHFQNFRACAAPSTIYPGMVRQVKLTVVPYRHKMIGLVSWQQPDNLGTAGRVDVYHVIWGVVDFKEVSIFFTFKTVLGHRIFPGFQLSADININVTNLTDSQTIGVKVLAAAPGQDIDETNGVIALASNLVPKDASSPGMKLLHYSSSEDGSWHDRHAHLSSGHLLRKLR